MSHQHDVQCCSRVLAASSIDRQTIDVHHEAGTIVSPTCMPWLAISFVRAPLQGKNTTAGQQQESRTPQASECRRHPQALVVLLATHWSQQPNTGQSSMPWSSVHSCLDLPRPNPTLTCHTPGATPCLLSTPPHKWPALQLQHPSGGMRWLPASGPLLPPASQ
jgi:hypothetical protein